MNFSIPVLKRILDQATRAERLIPNVGLLPGERMTRSGHLFEKDVLFNHAVANALAKEPELFPDIPVDPVVILNQQEHANYYYMLYDTFRGLMEQARDAYVYSQSEATVSSMSVINTVRADGQRPYKVPRHKERKMALWVAESYLDDRQRKKTLTARRREKKRLRLLLQAEQAPIASHPIAPIASHPIAPIASHPIAPTPRRSPQGEAVRHALRVVRKQRVAESAGHASDRTRLYEAFQRPDGSGFAGRLMQDRARRESAHSIQNEGARSAMGHAAPDLVARTGIVMQT